MLLHVVRPLRALGKHWIKLRRELLENTEPRNEERTFGLVLLAHLRGGHWLLRRVLRFGHLEGSRLVSWDRKRRPEAIKRHCTQAALYKDFLRIV